MKNRNGKKPDLSILKKILPKRTLHWQIAFTLLAFAAVVFFSYLIMNTAIRSHLARNSTLTLDLAITKMDAELLGPETTLRAFAETAQQRIQQGANINTIREFLVSFDKHLSYHTQDQTSPIYLFGVFYTLGAEPVFIHNGGWIPPEDYIPQNRPWYQAAVAGGGLPARSQLYMDRSSDQYVFAIAQSIQDESGRQLGVVCLQVPINHLGKIVKETAEAQGGYGMILGQDLRVHSHSNAVFEGMELPNPRLPFSIFYENFLRGEDVFEHPIISFAGEASLAFFRRTQDGWYYGTVVPQAPYYKSITNAWYALIMIGAFSAAFLLLILTRTDAKKNRATALTYSLNKMSEIFLTHNGNNFDDVMGTGGKLLAELADIDRFAILRNSTEGGDLYMSQVYRWEKAMGGTTRVNDNFVHVPYKRVAPAWEQMFKEGKSLSGPVRLMPEREAALLDSLGDYSAFIAPIHIGGAPWGFVLYEDQKRERHFDKALEETMQSAAFLLANAVLSAEFETKLAAERDFTRNIIDSAPIGINIWDDNLNIIDCNDAVGNIFGCTKEYYIEHFNEFSPEYQSDGERTSEKVKRLLGQVEPGESMVLEWEHLSAEGEPIPCELTQTKVIYNNKPLAVVYIYDLRNIKKMEAAALNAEQTLALIDAVPLGCALIDKNMNVLTCNKTEMEFFKLSKKEDIKRLFIDLVPEYQSDGSNSREYAAMAIKKAFDEGYAFYADWTHLNTQGEPLPCEVTLVRVEYGGDQVVAAYVRDMRAVKEAEAMAREADKRALLMIEHAPLIITLWNKDHQILDCNQAALRILGMASKEDYINKFYERTPERQPDGTPSYALVQGVLAKAFSDGYARFEWTSINAQTGEDIPMDVTFVRIKYKDEYAVMTYGLDLRERNAALAQTREAEQRVELMLEKAPLIALMWDSNFHLIDCNEEAARIFGLSNKEEVKKRFFELLPEYQPNGITSQEMLIKAQTMIFQEKLETTKIELTMHHAKTGEPIPIAITLVRIDDNSVLTYGHDLRERTAAIAKIREADERTQLIFDAAPLASCMFSKDIVALDCNQEMVKMCGLKDKESFLKRYTEFVPEYQPDGSLSSEATAKNIQTAFEKGYNQFEFIHRKESGELFPVKSTLLPVRYRGEDMIAAYFIDLTGQKEAERLTKEVMEKTATISAIFNSTSDMIFCKDINLFYTDCNRAMENYFNIRSSEIAGKHEANALKIPEEVAEHLIALDKKVLSERQEVTTEEMVKSFDGRMLCFEMVRSPLIQEGEITGLVGMARDITKRKAMEEDVKKAYAEAMSAYATAESALEAKNLFVANMNHEMRTPMNVIVGLTDLLLEEEKISGSVKETLYKINTAGNTLMGLIRDILDISKVDAGKMELTPVQYDVASFLNDIITLNIIRIEEKPITFKLDIQENLPRTLHGDDLRVKQILNNLLSNAFKYTKAGTVSLSINCQKDGDVVWTNFRITDTGIGVRKEDMSKLFTNYHQVDAKANRRIEGTGLGLSITKRLVELMNGEIMMDSEYGKGTTFHVRIKQDFVTEETIDKKTLESLRTFHYSDDKKRAQKKFERADLSYARVLVVDDFPTNLDVASGMLRKYKMKVDCVSSGQESIDVIALGKPVYDAIFMDHMMPEMDGIEAVKLIRALDTDYAKNIPIIALTANAVSDSEKMFLDNGFNAFLPKPFNAMSLDAVVQQWVKKSEQ